MRFHADLHVHSKHSRATSPQSDLEHLAWWGAVKGIGVVATGDFTHPAWRAELKEKLVPAEAGLFRLRPDIEHTVMDTLPPACREPVRFILSVEISTIYKKGDKTRKIHHLIYVPDFAAAELLVEKLSRIGNLRSDGRPILGLDSRHLLEITLESGPDSYLIPAHIWTPWFAVLGSKSGFDAVDECYGDLAHHVFAVETGLSSDPAMNWRVSSLDRFRLVSNSDAHSPGKLGRETTLFDTSLDYFSLKRALETGVGYVGTVEFFPEEGKYHMDGHRKCNLRTSPEETREHGGRCPVCGGLITVGVMHRIEALADRGENHAQGHPPATAGEVLSLVPLPEILSEILRSGESSRRVVGNYERLTGALGAELSILSEVPLEDIARADSSLLAEGIRRLRAGQVIRDAGYDGEYGVIRLFEDQELRRATAGGLLFTLPPQEKQKPAIAPRSEAKPPPVMAPRKEQAVAPGGDDILGGLDEDQKSAAQIMDGALMILAGPGSGKTRTLTHRIACLIRDCGLPPSQCLAVTFTRRASAEMRERLMRLLPEQGEEVMVHTFHSLGLTLLREYSSAAGLHRGFRILPPHERVALLAEALGVTPFRAGQMLKKISAAKRGVEQPAEETQQALRLYQLAMTVKNGIDLDDLIRLPVEMLASDPGLAVRVQERFRHIAIDEFQDTDALQYRLIRLLAPTGSHICLIGDPNQAIYGFRGASADCFDRFAEDYPEARTVRLARNYRSSSVIVAASSQVMGIADIERKALAMIEEHPERVTVHVAATERAEAEFIVQSIEAMIGGHSFFSIDSGRGAEGNGAALSFSDIAVLYRTEAQSEALAEALSRSGMPFRKHAHGLLMEHPAVQALVAALPAQGDLVAQIPGAAQSVEGHTAEELGFAARQLEMLASSCGGDRERFVDALALATEMDGWDKRADAIGLMTIHAAKGLEFPVVFLTGLEDTVLPLFWGSVDEETLAEERRLFYVGMTRAAQRLVLTRALRRKWRRVVREMAPSPFLTAIEARLLDLSKTLDRPRRDTDKQLTLL